MVAHRPSKSPLIFGAKTDREMREWMMSIKLLAEKLNSNPSVPVSPDGGLIVASEAVAKRRMSQPAQHLLQASRWDDMTYRSSPQLQAITSRRWSTGQLYTCTMVGLLLKLLNELSVIGCRL